MEGPSLVILKEAVKEFKGKKITRATAIEDPLINDPVMQARLYGQKDHVRIYTLDNYTTRLGKAGFKVKVISYSALMQFSMHALQENEPLVLGYKS